jgi:hypothetical protein
MEGEISLNRRLGKLPVRTDVRNIKLKAFLKPDLLVVLPTHYNVDEQLSVNMQPQMLGNDQWGDCVIVGRANWTLRAEYFEQKKELPITTNDCLIEYWKEQGGNSDTQPDEGLVMLDSLREWKKGWVAAKNPYTIYAFAQIEVSDHTSLCYAIMLLNGTYIGFQFPNSAMDQFNHGQPWIVVPGSPINGGHAVYVVGWNATGPICLTWGQKQQMTWAFYDKYVDEAYAMVNDKDEFVTDSPVDIAKFTEYLHNLANDPSQYINITITSPDAIQTNITVPVDLQGKFEFDFQATVKGIYNVLANHNADTVETMITVT